MRRTLQRNMPALLELFKGAGSIGRAFEARGWEVVSLDILPKFTPTICCDILRWDYRAAFPPGRFDFVWASPVCTEYSQALTTRPRRLHEGDALVLRAIEIIAYLAPRLWAIENPQTGLLKTRPFMQRLGFVDATYCLYGTPFKKQTRFWTNMRWAPSCGLCGPGNRCEAWRTAGTHAPHKGVPGKSASATRTFAGSPVSCCTAFQRRSVTRLRRQQARLNRKAGPAPEHGKHAEDARDGSI